MFYRNTIRLFWWNEIKIQGKTYENFGDLLGKYLVEKISGKKVKWSNPSRWSVGDVFCPVYLTIGSIITHANFKCVVWGSGIISKKDKIQRSQFLAVRGPQTRKYLLKQGHEVPEIFGDPALLVPRYYKSETRKKHKIGIIPHYIDYDRVKKLYSVNDDVTLIDMRTNNIESTIEKILECEKIVSSSLHGIIVAHAYGIPAVWQKFSNNIFGDDIKFQDYFESVFIPVYKPDIIDCELELISLESLFVSLPNGPSPEVIEKICNQLLKVCPLY